VASGVADAFALSGEELAIVAGSHSGAAEHVEVVRRLLEKAGFPASALVCGAVEHNCSGKHSGMLLLARHLGVSGVGYHQEEHPVQREIHAYVASLLDGQTRGRHEAGDAVGCTDRQGSRALFAGTDGCGVPVLGMTLREAAWLFAQLAAGATPALARVRDAMVAHPSLVAGEGRLDTELMRAAAGAIVCKAGAEGVQGIGLRDVAAARLGEGTARPGEVPEPAMAVGCVTKMEDGSGRSVPAVTVAVLRAWGFEREAAAVEQSHPAGITNRTGAVVARIEAVVEAAAVRRPLHRLGAAHDCGDEAGWGAAGRVAAGAPAPAARRFLGSRGDAVTVSRGDEKDVLRFLRDQWPSVDKEYFGRAVEWTAEPYALVYRRDRKVVGVLKGHFIGGLASVDELMVGDGARGCGLGSLLLGRFEDEARRRRCTRIVLRAVKGSPAEDFYRQRGYHRECVQYGYEFGYDYVRLMCDPERVLGEPEGLIGEPKGGS
jgi:L-asparaginase II/ribosomal protein S18 acetylase RimI-like enzyme